MVKVTNNNVFSHDRLQAFTKEWLSISDFDIPVGHKFSTDADYFGVNISQKHIAYVLQMQCGENDSPDDFEKLGIPYFWLDQTHAIFISSDTDYPRVYKTLQNIPFKYMGISDENFDLSRSIKDAIVASLFSNPATPIVRYRLLQGFQFYMDSGVTNQKIVDKLNHILAMPSGVDLLTTFWLYVINNGNMGETADAMHTHRNTLAYRLDSLYKLTGYNPKNYREMSLLTLGLIDFRMQNRKVLFDELQAISNNMLPRDKTFTEK